MPARLFILLGCLALLSFHALPAQAYVYYDLDALGVPKFVNTNYIDLNKITQISKFCSSAGHDYHDDKEYCRSMKHYFIAPDSTTTIKSPVSGAVSRMDDDFVGKQVHINSDAQQAFDFIIFHVILAKPLQVGDRIEEGQILGTHAGTITFSDIAVAVNTPTAYRLVSYFDTLTDDAFAAFQARGITSRDQMVFTKAVRDAAPYQCAGSDFINLKVQPDKEYVTLTGPTAAQQNITITQGFPQTQLFIASSPIVLSAKASSGLPVTIETSSPAICSTEGIAVTFLASGNCFITFRQVGDANTFEASTSVSAYVYDGFAYSGLVPGAADVTNTSFLRFLNYGSIDGAVKVNMYDSVTGDLLGKWASPTVPKYAEQQFYIGQLEAALTRRAASYTLSMQSDFLGSFQNIFFRGPDGALTNGTACGQGVQAEAYRLSGVHSSLLPNYPSAIVVNNAGDTATKPVELQIFDTIDGHYIGTYTTPIIAAHSRLPVTAAAIEGVIGKPRAGLYHYVVLTSGFTGYLQHLVFNQAAGITTDLTASCAMDGTLHGYGASTVQFGKIIASADTDTRSSLRIVNQANLTGTATVTVWDETSGQKLGQWTSPSILGGQGRDFSVSEIESALTFSGARPPSYAISVQSNMYAMAIQHVTTRVADGAEANQTTCGINTNSDPSQVIGVRPSTYTAFPTQSAIVVTNKGGAAQTVSLGVYEVRSGLRLGTYTIDALPAHAQRTIAISALEAGAHITSVASDLYRVKVDGTFTGLIQHVLYNQNARITTDASPYCNVLQTVPTTKFNVTTSFVGNGSATLMVNPSGPFNYGANVNATAALASGSYLLGWAGDCPGISACLLYMTENKNAIAVLGSGAGVNGPSYYVLSVSGTVTDGIGGTVTATGVDINCTTRGVNFLGGNYPLRSGSCALPVANGTQMTFSATPARGSKFVGWSGYDCGEDNVISSAPTCTLKMTTNRIVTAVFAAAD